MPRRRTLNNNYSFGRNQFPTDFTDIDTDIRNQQATRMQQSRQSQQMLMSREQALQQQEAMVLQHYLQQAAAAQQMRAQVQERKRQESLVDQEKFYAASRGKTDLQLAMEKAQLAQAAQAQRAAEQGNREIPWWKQESALRGLQAVGRGEQPQGFDASDMATVYGPKGISGALQEQIKGKAHVQGLEATERYKMADTARKAKVDSWKEDQGNALNDIKRMAQEMTGQKITGDQAIKTAQMLGRKEWNNRVLELKQQGLDDNAAKAKANADFKERWVTTKSRLETQGLDAKEAEYISKDQWRQSSVAQRGEAATNRLELDTRRLDSKEARESTKDTNEKDKELRKLYTDSINRAGQGIMGQINMKQNPGAAEKAAWELIRSMSSPEERKRAFPGDKRSEADIGFPGDETKMASGGLDMGVLPNELKLAEGIDNPVPASLASLGGGDMPTPNTNPGGDNIIPQGDPRALTGPPMPNGPSDNLSAANWTPTDIPQDSWGPPQETPRLADNQWTPQADDEEERKKQEILMAYLSQYQGDGQQEDNWSYNG